MANTEDPESDGWIYITWYDSGSHCSHEQTECDSLLVEIDSVHDVLRRDVTVLIVKPKRATVGQLAPRLATVRRNLNDNTIGGRGSSASFSASTNKTEICVILVRGIAGSCVPLNE
jgi:hypothetical protein